MMKMTLIAATLLIPASLSAQTVAQGDAIAPTSKVNVAIRPDVAARPITQSDAPATVGDVRVRTARTGGGKTVTLQNGTLPDAQASGVVAAQALPGN